MELNKQKLLELYPSYDSVLGPYLRPDGRQHIVLNNSSASKGTKGKTKTISYPKALIESNINKRLLPNETVDHDDRDKTNDTSNNLIIRDRSEHASLDAKRVSVDSVNCPNCNKFFEPTTSQRNSNRTMAGPFCSRQCSGKYIAAVRTGEVKPVKQEIVKNYFFKEK